MSSNKESATTRKRREYSRKGLCGWCGANPPKPTSTLCSPCTDKSTARSKQYALENRAKGLCTCGRARDRDGKRLCSRCMAYRTLPPEKKLRKRCLMYGIDELEYAQILKQQDGVCAICRRPPNGRWDSLAIDHCHSTGTVRGLLCGSCNKAIGCLQDSPENLHRAIEYLIGAKQKTLPLFKARIQATA